MIKPNQAILAAALLAASLAGAAGAETFTPRSYVKAALGVSPSMRRAEQAFRQAESSYKSALLDAALPAFSLGLSQTWYDQADTRLRLESEDVSSYLAASWNLYDSASSPLKKVKTARLDYEAARLAFLTAKQAEAVKALNRFYALYSAQKRIGTAKMDLASRERQYKDTNEQFQSGTRSRMQVTQSEVDKLQSELSLAQAESAEAKARMAFNELLNADPEAGQAVEVSTQAVQIALPLPRSDAAKALAGNLALRQQRLALQKTRITNRNSVLANYPRLRVDAAWRKSQLGLVGEPRGPRSGNPAYSLGASLNFPFGFFGLQNYLDIDAAGAALRSAELDLENSERALRTSVLSAQKDIELQVKSRQLLEVKVKAQNETTGNLMSEYSQGGADSLQLDSAQTKLLDASNAQIAALNDLDLAVANYRVLLGEQIWE